VCGLFHINAIALLRRSHLCMIIESVVIIVIVIEVINCTLPSLLNQ
jgi:hypothetical protein